MKHEVKALASNTGAAPDAADGEQGAAPDGAESLGQAEGAHDNEAEDEKRAMEKAMQDAMVEQEARQAAAEDKRALGLSMQRVAELEVRNTERELFNAGGIVPIGEGVWPWFLTPQVCCFSLRDVACARDALLRFRGFSRKRILRGSSIIVVVSSVVKPPPPRLSV